MSKKIVLVGNPNSGKSTLFNGFTGGNQRIGNWPGVTVEKIEGSMKGCETSIEVLDLPGIYSMSAFSEDEIVARNCLLNREADLIVNIVDASNLDRNLYLTTQLLEMKIPMIVVLNRIDLAKKQNKIIDADALAIQLGCPVIVSSAFEKGNIGKIRESIVYYLDKDISITRKIEYPNEIEDLLSQITPLLTKYSCENNIDTRWLSLKFLENDEAVKQSCLNFGVESQEELEKDIARAESILGESIDIIIADYKYAFIQGVTRKVVSKKTDKKEVTDIIDRVVLNRFLGIPFFLFVMYMVFWVTLSIGGAFIDFFDILSGAIFVDGTASVLGNMGAPLWLTTLMSKGVGAGIQAVSVFIPIIFAMFFMLSLLEDSGYMARAAFVMDRFMRLIGLPGKSFVPMVIGFGCTVPAIMAARTLEEKKDRIMTIFITPFMSCGARLSVYILFTAVFFQENAGLIVFSLYLVGAVLAILTGVLMKKAIYLGEPSYFVMELPIYNLPRLRHIFIHTWLRLKLFIFGAGKVIIVAVIILSFINSLGSDGSFGNENTEKSYLTRIGKIMQPAFEPMGVSKENWPATVAIFTGPFAKEAIVGTLNSLYSQTNRLVVSEEENKVDFLLTAKNAFLSVPENLKGAFAGILDPLGIELNREDAVSLQSETGFFSVMRRHFYSPIEAYAYLLFVMIYFPCVATVGAVYREVGMFIAGAQIVYMTVLAWVVSVLFYQIAVGMDLVWIALSISLLGILILSFFVVGIFVKKNKKVFFKKD